MAGLSRGYSDPAKFRFENQSLGMFVVAYNKILALEMPFHNTTVVLDTFETTPGPVARKK